MLFLNSYFRLKLIYISVSNMESCREFKSNIIIKIDFCLNWTNSNENKAYALKYFI